MRSFMMSRIRSKNTIPEKRVRSFLFSRGFRYRLHDNKLPGRPDIVLKKYRTVIQVKGCFWHVHNCKYFSFPKSNKIFWKKKLLSNVERDSSNQKKLKKLGWTVINVWECKIRKENFKKLLKDLEIKIRKN